MRASIRLLFNVSLALAVLLLLALQPAITQGTTVVVSGAAAFPDSAPAPAAEASLYDTASGLEYITTTTAQGQFRFENVEPGLYELVLAGTGIGPNRDVVSVGPQGFTYPSTVRIPRADSTGPTVAGAVNGASFLPDYFPQAALAGNMIAVIYGTFPGINGLVQAPSLPLTSQLAGVRIEVTSGSTQYPAFPIYASPSQLAAVLPSNVPEGPADLVVHVNGVASLPWGIEVAKAQPGTFTVDGSGQRYGIFTTLNYELVTKQVSAQPGKTYIAWVTGLGNGARDDLGGAFDKRPSYVDYSVFAGGEEVPKANVYYMGSDGNIPGLDLVVFDMPAEAATGCSSTFFVSIQTGPTEEDIRTSIPTLIPIMPTGGVCGDDYSLSESEVSELFNPPPSALRTAGQALRLGTWRLRETSTLTTTTQTDRLGADFFVNEVSGTTYVPTNAAETCVVLWAVPNLVNPSAPTPGVITGGNVLATMPGAFIDLNANTNNGPFSHIYATTDRIVDGQLALELRDISVRFGQTNSTSKLNAKFTEPFSVAAWRARRSADAAFKSQFQSNGIVDEEAFYNQTLAVLQDVDAQNLNVIVTANQSQTSKRRSLALTTQCHAKKTTKAAKVRRQKTALKKHRVRRKGGNVTRRYFPKTRNRKKRPENDINAQEQAVEGVGTYNIGDFRNFYKE